MSFYIKQLINLKNFEPWGGAIWRYEALMNSDSNVIDEVSDYIEMWADAEQLTETQLNDFFFGLT